MSVKLNEYVEILGTVGKHGSTNLGQILSSIRIDQGKLTQALTFLQSRGYLLLETSGGNAIPYYSITESGLRILDFFNYRT